MGHALIAALLLSVAGSQTFTETLHVPDAEPEVIPAESGESILAIEGGLLGWLEGYPDLPVVAGRIPLGEGLRASAVEVRSASWEQVPGLWRIRPLPPPAIPSLPWTARVGEPRADVYSADAFWPPSPVELTGTGYSHGTGIPVAELLVHPFRYNPVTGSLERLSGIEISVGTEPCRRELRLPPSRQTCERMLIITDTSLLQPFDSLAHWRTEGGVLTEVVTTSEVSGWPGCDLPEKMRNYIIDYYSANGLDYVLLGGDTDLVPCRYAFALSYQTGGGRDDSLPCDLYFSDLDGSWNLDMDDIWGELADSVDLYPDVWVGRAPVENLGDAWAVVDKTIAYETASETSHLDRALLIAAVMWSNPYTDGGVLKDYIDEMYIPSLYEVEKQYESEGTYGTGEAMTALIAGTGHVNLTSHGWITVVGPLDISAVDAIDSAGRFFGFMYATGCWTSAFDLDAVGEHFLTNPKGCGVSYIENSSYGWRSPGNPLYGYSDRMDRELWRLLVENPSWSLGELLGQAKVGMIPFSHQENTYRCLQYMVNLLGDPSLRVHRIPPVDPDLELPPIVTSSTQCIPLTLSAPVSVEGATVCIHDEGYGIYVVEELDASGHAIIDLPGAVSSDITVTVTGTHLRRTSETIPYASGPSLVVSSLLIDDSAGYGHLSPGATADLSITLLNQGTVSLTGVELQAELVSGPAQLLSSTVDYGSLSPGQSGSGSGVVALDVEASSSTGQVVQLLLHLSCDQGSWEVTLPLLVYAPGLYFSIYSVDDSAGGNGNGYPEAGESFDLILTIANLGLLEASDVYVTMPDGPTWLTWDIATAYLPQIAADGTGEFTVSGELSAGAPDVAFPELLFSITAAPEWQSSDTLILVVGDIGVSEDVESGPGGWTHGGTNDLWHVTESSAHSGTHSWHSG
ncbi:hypothetical protein JW921_08270, partial [Candidatus Fermentibacterales bacterium]|nr:hypothetical protein [Candidatus Fermentibacterales bacterium]